MTRRRRKRMRMDGRTADGTLAVAAGGTVTTAGLPDHGLTERCCHHGTVTTA